MPALESMSPPSPLDSVLAIACEDAFLGLISVGIGALPLLSDPASPRREARRLAATDTGNVATLQHGDAWVVALVRALTSDATPRFVPMRAAIEDGMTLRRPARGLRALLPGGAADHAELVRGECVLALRVLRAACAAGGVVDGETQRRIAVLVAATGLEGSDVEPLLAEAPMPAAAIPIPPGLDLSLAHALIEGAWEAASSERPAAGDGAAVMTVPALRALTSIAGRLGVADPTAVFASAEARVTLLRSEAREEVEALVDVARYLLHDRANARLSAFVDAALEISVGASIRDEIRHSARATTPLSRPHTVAKERRIDHLGAVWAMVLSTDPRSTTRVSLGDRHDRASVDLGGPETAHEARREVARYVEACLNQALSDTTG